MAHRPRTLRIISAEANSPPPRWRRVRQRDLLIAFGLVGFLALGLLFSRRPAEEPPPSPAPEISQVVERPKAVLLTAKREPPELIDMPLREFVEIEPLTAVPREWVELLPMPPLAEMPRPMADKLSPTEPPKRDPRLRTFDTGIDFFESAELARELAKKDGKLVLSLKYAGRFEDGKFTCEAMESLRKQCLKDRGVEAFVAHDFVCSAESIGGQLRVEGKLTGGNVVSFVTLPNGKAVHAIPGGVSAPAFSNELTWALKIVQQAAAEADDEAKLAKRVRKAHADRYFSMGSSDEILPRDMPANASAQQKIHWLFAAGPRQLDSVDELNRHVFRQVFAEKFLPPN